MRKVIYCTMLLIILIFVPIVAAEKATVVVEIQDCNKIGFDTKIKIRPRNAYTASTGSCTIEKSKESTCTCYIDTIDKGVDYVVRAYVDSIYVDARPFKAFGASKVTFQAGGWKIVECTKGQKKCENGLLCKCIEEGNRIKWDCNACEDYKICLSGQNKCKRPDCDGGESGTTKCMDGLECACLGPLNYLFFGLIPIPVPRDYDWYCKPCDSTKECNTASGRCEIIQTPVAAEQTSATEKEQSPQPTATCKPIKYEGEKNKKCTQKCTCEDALSGKQCEEAIQKILSGYKIVQVNIESATAEKDNVEAKDCQVDEETKAEQEAKEEAKPFVDMIVDEKCKKPEGPTNPRDLYKLVGEAEAYCDVYIVIGPFTSATYQIIAVCKEQVREKCSKKLGVDLEIKLLTCDETCDAPKCHCPSECPVVEDSGAKGTVRWDQAQSWHITQGWNCRYEQRTDKAGQDCSGNFRDGICPRFCFFFNDIDCRSEKTAGYFLGDMINKFIQKQQWYMDFMQWVEGWSKWIDPQQWAKSWCNPANREGDLLISPAVYTDDGEPLAWYGGEIQIYNYTSTDTVSRYIYLITWGIASLDVDVEYKISLMKSIDSSAVKAFPGRKDWFELDAGESHQGKDTAKTFFLKDVYQYVCLEFNESVEGSARHCREFAAAGEYRATGDPAVPEGAASIGGSTDPANDNTINCELTNTC